MPPRLHERLAGAPLVVAGHVSRVQPHDVDRVRVIHFTVDRVMKGRERLPSGTGSVEIIEMRDRAAAPDLLTAGDFAVAFLAPMGRGSYLDRTLGPGRRWQVPESVFGLLKDRDRTVVSQAGDLVNRLADQSRAPAETAAERREVHRRWVFDAIAALHSGLVEDGAAELPSLGGKLSSEEQTRLDRAVRRTDLPPRIRARLIDSVGEARLEELAPVLADVTRAPAPVLDAAWRARAAVGVPPAESTYEPYLRDADPEVREVAVRRFITAHPDSAVPRMGAFLTGETKSDVRIAVLEALSTVPANGEAVELLEGAFVGDQELIVRQAAGRLIFAIGGDIAAESFGRLAFAANSEGQRHAVALLMAMQRPAGDPILQRIRDTHPDAKVHEILEHGFSDPHEH